MNETYNYTLNTHTIPAKYLQIYFTVFFVSVTLPMELTGE